MQNDYSGRDEIDLPVHLLYSPAVVEAAGALPQVRPHYSEHLGVVRTPMVRYERRRHE